jgi:hypothetical protein
MLATAVAIAHLIVRPEKCPDGEKGLAHGEPRGRRWSHQRESGARPPPTEGDGHQRSSEAAFAFQAR